MIPWLRIPYTAAGATAEWIAALAPASSTSKLARTFAARHDLISYYERWGATQRDVSRPLLWIHAPSVGEGLMALPVVQRVRQELSAVQIAYTFFSPSAESFARRMPVDFTAYLPFDTPRAADRALNALRPTALVFSKLDVWPVLVERAHGRGVRLGLISASVSPRSARRGIGATVTRQAYAALDRVGAVSQEDASRLVDTGARTGHVRITGDTRYDQALERSRTGGEHLALVEVLRSSRPTVVAGSTWPADEARLLPAWERVVSNLRDARLVIAPHEIREAHVRHIEAWARRAGVRCARFGTREAVTADVILVDRIGVLADLYALADVAYVGGGFHTAGLHSVVEPAVVGTPVVIGPRHAASRDAHLLLGAGGAIAAWHAEALADLVRRLLTHPEERRRMTAALHAVVSAELGATARSLELVLELLGAV